MQKQVNRALLEFLHIVKYPHDKQKFVKEFEELNHLETMANMLDNFPLSIQEKIKKSEGKIDEIKQHLLSEEYQKEFSKVSYQALQKYIEVISPIITLDQKEKIQKLLKQ